MEDSGGRYGVDLTAFGLYRMPGKSHEYGMEFQSDADCPAGDDCSGGIRTEGKAAWVAEQGPEVPAGFDFVFFLSAGQDESSTWQEFEMMKFPTKEDVSETFGPPIPRRRSGRTPGTSTGRHGPPASIWPGTGPLAKITLTATSESDPTKSSTATCIAIKH